MNILIDTAGQTLTARTLTSPDGQRRAPITAALSESWTDEDRAAFGVYRVAIEPPAGQRWTGEIEDGQPVYEEIPPPTAEEIEAQRVQDRTRPEALTAALEVVARLVVAPALESLGAEADKVAPLFPDWRVGQDYSAGDVLNYAGAVVEVIQGHTSQADWVPTDTPALYKTYRAPNGTAPWVQPQGGHDAYQIGERVTHNGKTWASDVANNVWEPGVYGWSEV